MLGKTFSPGEILAALLLGIAVFLLSGFLFIKVLANSLYDEQVHAGERLLAFVSEADYEIQKALKELNSLGFTTCNETTLKEMRKAVFAAKYVKEIGYFDDNVLICTTATGILPTPYVGKNIPDYIGTDGTRIWSDVNLLLFDNKYSASIIRVGKYNVVFDKALLLERVEPGFKYQINYRIGDKQEYFAGDPDFKDEPLNIFWWQALKKHLPYYDFCSNKSPHCIKMAISNDELGSRQTMALDVLLMACIFLGFIFAFLLLKYFTWNKSFKRRIYNASKGDRLYCRYLPIVDLSSNKIIGVEVLARLKDKHGTISPDDFIPIIENKKMTWKFTKTITDISLTELRTLPRISKDFEVNINIFPADIINPAIRAFGSIEKVAEFPGKICLDIIESPELNQKEAIESARQLLDVGIEISIDDFGTGDSNLALLQQTPFTQLKIDRSITKDIDLKSVKSSVIPHIVNISKELDKTVLAEGIETQAQLDSLVNLGIQRGQGWLLGKPMSINKLIKVIEENRIEKMTSKQVTSYY